MTILKEQPIGELVAQDYRTASVFKKYGIDYCCQGSRTIEQACFEKDIEPINIVNDLSNISVAVTSDTTDFKTWPLDLLADYIEKKHHRYVRHQITEIQPILAKICSVHGGRHPELLEVKELFTASAEELGHHMQKEEQILFPYVRKLWEATSNHTEMEAPFFATAQNPIRVMMQEHNTEGERFRRIEELTNGYTAPADGCNTYIVTLALLKEFEADLHLHIHLENNILFPAVIELEKQIQ